MNTYVKYNPLVSSIARSETSREYAHSSWARKEFPVD
jgi:hypothetical protein